MRKYLFILFCLPLFAQVPNTTTFNFIDVKDEIEDNGGATTNSLTAAFTNANAAGFDPAYEGSKNSLLNFRNYQHIHGFIYSGESYNVSSQESFGTMIFFKPDGTKMYVGGTGNDAIFAYTLSTAWNVTTASYSGETYEGDSFNSIQSLSFKSDGTQMYVLGAFATTQIRQYTLSTAWNISTASFTDDYTTLPQGNAREGLFVKPDGTGFYITGGPSVTPGVWQYTMSTPWDLTTASYASITKDISSQVTLPSGVFFKSDGTKMFVTDSFNSRIYQYTLSTAWNVSTATYDSLDYFFGSTMSDLYIKSDGLQFFFIRPSTATVFKYITNFPWSIED